MQLFAGELTNQNREYYKVRVNALERTRTITDILLRGRAASKGNYISYCPSSRALTDLFYFEEVFQHESIYFKDFKSRFFDSFAQILSA